MRIISCFLTVYSVLAAATILAQEPVPLATSGSPSGSVTQTFLPPEPWMQTTPKVAVPGPPATMRNEPNAFERFYQDDLFHYTWIDYGAAPGLRIHRIEMTNTWTDLRSIHFFSRTFLEDINRLQTGLSFAVQWLKDEAEQIAPAYDSQLPPVWYDLYFV
ncbi:MAG TPA: hypothetical protein PKA06_17005, partial [Gemmatales bacterium]|nr:hypothetical protein [Gemmatales bacterium]